MSAPTTDYKLIPIQIREACERRDALQDKLREQLIEIAETEELLRRQSAHINQLWIEERNKRKYQQKEEN